MRKWIVQGLTPILCGLALLLGMIGLGRAARASLHDRSTFSLAFTDIDCQPPEGMSREAFLSEVRAHTRQPPALRLLDEDLIARLHRAFSVHPWVDSVGRVDIGKPRRARRAKTSVHLELAYRRPVLAVPLSTEDNSGERMADGGSPGHPAAGLGGAGPSADSNCACRCSVRPAGKPLGRCPRRRCRQNHGFPCSAPDAPGPGGQRS